MSGTLTSDDIAVVIVNYRTPDLLEKSVSSFRRFYPGIEMLIVDNGSGDGSGELIDSLITMYPTKTKKMMLDRNHFHGPAMDMALREAGKEAIFFMDTDTETVKGGFFEKMLDKLNGDGKAYGVGRVDMVNKRGFSTDKGSETILISAYMMLRRSIYLTLPPFIHHGMPTLQNFSGAVGAGYRLLHFDIGSYIRHAGRGTASRFGYGLGFRSKLDFLLNKVGL